MGCFYFSASIFFLSPYQNVRLLRLFTGLVGKVRDWIATGKLPNYRWEDVALADFVRDPRGQLGRLCGFLGLDCAAADFAARAASIVRPSEHASRDELIWPPATYDRLREAVAKVYPSAKISQS